MSRKTTLPFMAQARIKSSSSVINLHISGPSLRTEHSTTKALKADHGKIYILSRRLYRTSRRQPPATKARPSHFSTAPVLSATSDILREERYPFLASIRSEIYSQYRIPLSASRFRLPTAHMAAANVWVPCLLDVLQPLLLDHLETSLIEWSLAICPCPLGASRTHFLLGNRVQVY